MEAEGDSPQTQARKKKNILTPVHVGLSDDVDRLSDNTLTLSWRSSHSDAIIHCAGRVLLQVEICLIFPPPSNSRTMSTNSLRPDCLFTILVRQIVPKPTTFPSPTSRFTSTTRELKCGPNSDALSSSERPPPLTLHPHSESLREAEGVYPEPMPQ